MGDIESWKAPIPMSSLAQGTCELRPHPDDAKSVRTALARHGAEMRVVNAMGKSLKHKLIRADSNNPDASAEIRTIGSRNNHAAAAEGPVVSVLGLASDQVHQLSLVVVSPPSTEQLRHKDDSTTRVAKQEPLVHGKTLLISIVPAPSSPAIRQDKDNAQVLVVSCTEQRLPSNTNQRNPVGQINYRLEMCIVANPFESRKDGQAKYNPDKHASRSASPPPLPRLTAFHVVSQGPARQATIDLDNECERFDIAPYAISLVRFQYACTVVADPELEARGSTAVTRDMKDGGDNNQKWIWFSPVQDVVLPPTPTVVISAQNGVHVKWPTEQRNWAAELVKRIPHLRYRVQLAVVHVRIEQQKYEKDGEDSKEGEARTVVAAFHNTKTKVRALSSCTLKGLLTGRRYAVRCVATLRSATSETEGLLFHGDVGHVRNDKNNVEHAANESMVGEDDQEPKLASRHRIKHKSSAKKKYISMRSKHLEIDLHAIPPEPPGHVMVSHYMYSDKQEKHVFMQVSWDPSQSNGLPVLEYIVQRMKPLAEHKPSADSGDRWELVHRGLECSCVLSASVSLSQPIRGVTFRVFAVNKAGQSIPSSSLLKFNSPSSSSTHARTADGLPLKGLSDVDDPNEQGNEKQDEEGSLTGEGMSFSHPIASAPLPSSNSKTNCPYPVSPRRRPQHESSATNAFARPSRTLIVRGCSGATSGTRTPAIRRNKELFAKRKISKLNNLYQVSPAAKIGTKRVTSEKQPRPPAEAKSGKQKHKPAPRLKRARLVDALASVPAAISTPTQHNKNPTATTHNGVDIDRGTEKARSRFSMRASRRRISDPTSPLSLTNYSQQVDRIYEGTETNSKPQQNRIEIARASDSSNGTDEEQFHARLHVIELKMEAQALKEARQAAAEMQQQRRAEMVKAAVRLQAEWRGSRTRHEVNSYNDELERSRTSLNLNSLQYKGSRSNRWSRKGNRSVSSPEFENEILEEVHAATAIQSGTRGMLARRQVSESELAGSSCVEQLELDTKAIVLQRQFRGLKARRDFQIRMLGIRNLKDIDTQSDDDDDDDDVNVDGSSVDEEDFMMKDVLEGSREEQTEFMESKFGMEGDENEKKDSGVQNHVAASVIQTSFRRRHLKKKEKEAAAASTIQSRIRGRNMRKINNEEADAASRIQKRVRQRNRSHTQQQRRPEEENNEEETDSLDLTSHDAASRIQRRIRGAQARRLVSKNSSLSSDSGRQVNEEKGEGIDDVTDAASRIQTQFRSARLRKRKKSESSSAVKIQAKFRGRQQRHKFVEKKQGMKTSATLLQRRFRGHNARANYDQLRTKIVGEISSVVVRLCGDEVARGVYELAGLENNAMRYMKMSHDEAGKEEEGITYVIERMLEKGKGLWTLYQINDAGEMKMLYGNRAEGQSLKPPRRQWQLIGGTTPPPRLQWESNLDLDTANDLNKDACVIMESGSAEVHGRYLGIGVSDGVPQFQLKNEIGSFYLRRVSYGDSSLWVLVGSVGENGEQQAFYFNSEMGTDECPPSQGWGLAQHGQTPLPLIVFQPSLASPVQRGRSRGGSR